MFRRWRSVLAVLALLLVAGMLALGEIGREAEPDIDVAVANVTVSLEGVRPQDADRLLVRPLERRLRNVEGIETLRSFAYAGGALLSLEFDDDFEADPTFERIRERLALAEADLPPDAGKPRLHEVNLGLAPLIVVTISGPVSDAVLIARARELRDALEALPAVLEVSIAGERAEVVEAVVDPLELESYGLDAEALIGLVARFNRAVRAGAADAAGGRLALSVPGAFTRAADVRDLPIKATQDSVVTLGDVAVVRRVLEQPTSLARLDGKPAIALAVTKRLGENAAETLDDIRDAVTTVTRPWPDGIETAYSQDRSWQVRTRLHELRNSLVTAVILVMAVIVATLGFRSGLLVGVAIPGSFLVAVLVLALLDVAVNTAVLFAFVMSVGLLVDGAIVMVEDANRSIAQGVAPRDAYTRSVRRLTLPIVTSTATTVAAFLPLLFWPGVVGEYLKFLPLTVVLTLGASLVMAVVFVPVLGASLPAGGGTASPAGSAVEGRRESPATRAYAAILEVALRRPGWVLAAAFAVLVWSMWIYERQGRDVELFPEVEPTSAVVRIHARGNLTLAEKRALALEAERIVRGYPAFASVYTRIGAPAGAVRGILGSDVVAEILAEFRPWREHAPAFAVLDDLESRLRGIAGVVVEVLAERGGPWRGKPVQIDLTGPDPATLDQAVAALVDNLATIPGIKAIEDSRPVPGVEWAIEIDREEAARHGLDAAKVGEYAKLFTSGLKLGTFEPERGEDEIDILLRLPERYRSVEGLRAARIATANGPVPLERLAHLRAVPRAGVVERIDGELARGVEADVARGALESDVVREAKVWLSGGGRNARVRSRIRGEDEDREETRDFLIRAFAAGFAAMAIILVAQFNSFYSAFVTLLSIVLATAGVRIGLLFIDQPFSVVMSGVGIIALAGIVVNNNIVLIDTYDRLRREGLDPVEALRRTGRTRLRPVLLTSVTTIAALAPFCLGLDIDWIDRTLSFAAPSTQYWRQVSSAIVFGLAFATALTLLVTPAALVARARFTEAQARERARGDSESVAVAFRRYGFPVAFAAATAVVAAWVFIPELVVVRIVDIFGKQLFEKVPSTWFKTLEGAAFWSLTILGAAYAYWKNDHVRVDIIRDRLSQRGKAIIEVGGFVLLLAPVCIVILLGGYDFVVQSFLREEQSGALLGLPALWVFKAMILVCFAQLLVLGGYVTFGNLQFLRGRAGNAYPPERDAADAGDEEEPP